jgi:hypothetical protein
MTFVLVTRKVELLPLPTNDGTFIVHLATMCAGLFTAAAAEEDSRYLLTNPSPTKAAKKQQRPDRRDFAFSNFFIFFFFFFFFFFFLDSGQGKENDVLEGKAYKT